MDILKFIKKDNESLCHKIIDSYSQSDFSQLLRLFKLKYVFLFIAFLSTKR